MPGLGAQCPRSSSGQEQEGLRGAETRLPHLKSGRTEGLRGVKSGPHLPKQAEREAKQGGNKKITSSEIRRCRFRPVTVTPCKYPTLFCVPHLGGNHHRGPTVISDPGKPQLVPAPLAWVL